jgi:internalin A
MGQTRGKPVPSGRCSTSVFNDDEESTSCIALSDWVMEDCKKGPVTAHVWDFAGQVMTHALHQFFFSVRCVYVLVLTGHTRR